MKLTVIGSGDAFGSGGRLQTCLHVAAADTRFLIDCGATAMIGMNGLGLDPNRVDTIFITHLHGDHFAGLVWWMLHAQHVARRETPLAIVGPRGVAARYAAAAEALFPSNGGRPPKFTVGFHEIDAGVPIEIGGVRTTAYLVSHPSGAPSHALRLEIDGRTIGFSGDTEWVEALVDVARDADLYISECHGYDTPAPYHMCWRGIERRLGQLSARRILLTHMSNDMLQHAGEIDHERVMVSHDGLEVDL
jgi:ribonuclease BN (tRNA processing enzyme)